MIWAAIPYAVGAIANFISANKAKSEAEKQAELAAQKNAEAERLAKEQYAKTEPYYDRLRAEYSKDTPSQYSRYLNEINNTVSNRAAQIVGNNAANPTANAARLDGLAMTRAMGLSDVYNRAKQEQALRLQTLLDPNKAATNLQNFHTNQSAWHSNREAQFGQAYQQGMAEGFKNVSSAISAYMQPGPKDKGKEPLEVGGDPVPKELLDPVDPPKNYNLPDAYNQQASTLGAPSGYNPGSLNLQSNPFDPNSPFKLYGYKP